jgi:hypothetical protein
MNKLRTPTEKCDDIYNLVISLDSGQKDSLFELAQCFIDGYDPAKLHSMLLSQDEGIVIDGLFVVGEIGNLLSNYVEELKLLSQSTDPLIAKDARRLMEKLG